MSKSKENKNAEAETIDNGDAETTEETEDETTEETTEETAAAGDETEETEDEGSAGNKDLDKDDKIDYDKEIETEKKRGKPDPAIASEAFKGRKQKRDVTVDEETDGDDDKPLTRKDIAAIEARVERKALTGQALSIAKTLAGRHANSDKEAQLIVARWGNRTFPTGTPLMDQLEEVYAGMHRRKIIGERDEALRALAGRSSVGRNAAGSHRQPSSTAEPKIAPQNASAIKAAGFAWNGVTRRYEKKLSSGGIVIRDPKTGATQLMPKK